LLCQGLFSHAKTNSEFAIADSLLLARRYDDAAMEFERVFFLSGTESTKDSALIAKARCLKLSGDYKNEQRTLLRLEVSHLADSVRYQVYYERALACYLADDFENAANEFIQMNYFVKDTLLIRKSLFLQILVLNELHRWEDGKFLYRTFLEEHQLTYDSLPAYSFLETKTFKSASKARLLSMVFPGAGQAYAGNFWKGISGNLLFDASAYYTIKSILDTYYISALLTGGIFIFRFYSGGIYYSENLVKQYNDKRSHEINEAIKKIILAVQ